MIRTHSHRQLSLAEFDWPFQIALDENNRWVKMSECIPWDELRETVAQIQENPYLQYFVGLPGYQMQAPFVPSLFVEIRKRMGQSVFDVFHNTVIEAVDNAKQKPAARRKKSEEQSNDDNQPPVVSDGDPESDAAEPAHQGKLILDATVAPQAIRFPTDLGLLNEARELSEQIIDKLYAATELKTKPRTYRRKARKAYLSIVKKKRPGAKLIRRGIKQQLQYLRRNLGQIEHLLAHFPEYTQLPLPRWLLHRYWVIQHVYAQQWEMYRNKTKRCDDRIVSISQPYVRPIVRGKVDKPTEFGAKLSVSLTGEGVARVDPESVLADTIYGSRDNRRYLKGRGIRFAGKPLGRPKKVTEENREESICNGFLSRASLVRVRAVTDSIISGRSEPIRPSRGSTASSW
jgi:hypothetical protein